MCTKAVKLLLGRYTFTNHKDALATFAELVDHRCEVAEASSGSAEGLGGCYDDSGPDHPSQHNFLNSAHQ